MLMSTKNSVQSHHHHHHHHIKQNTSLDSGFGDCSTTIVTTESSSPTMTPINVPTAAPSPSQSQTHINKLLHTAAAANGLVDDVDALLTPIQRSASSLSGGTATTTTTPNGRFENRPERNLWRTEEMLQMLRLMQATNAMQQLNDKNVKSEKIFRHVEQLMHQNGYVKKSHVQIWTKWKFLKSTYTTSKRNGIVPKMIPPPVYEELHKMLDQTVDCGATPNNSMDGDSSSGVGIGGGAAGMAGAGQLVIAGVEGGYQESGSGKGAKDEASFDMVAHPIFGFRLGSVKQEPADTGYEVVPSDAAPTTQPTLPCAFNEMPEPVPLFNAVIKKEIDIQSRVEFNPTTTTTTVAPALSADTIRSRRPRQVPLRYSNCNVATPTPTATVNADPTATIDTATPKPNSHNKKNCAASPVAMPPLRIAPFAKVPYNDVMNGLIKPFERPLPPLTMNPQFTPTTSPNTATTSTAIGTTMRLRSPAAMNGKNVSLQRRSTPKASAAAAAAMATPAVMPPTRLAKDISVQTRGATAAAAAAVAAINGGTSELPRQDTMIMSRPKTTPQQRKSAVQQMIIERPVPTQLPRTPQLPTPAELFNELPSGSQSHHNNNKHTTNLEALEQMQFAGFVGHATPTKNGKRKQRFSQPENLPPPAGIKVRRTQGMPQNDTDGCEGRQEAATAEYREAQFDEAMHDLCSSLREMQREMLREFYGHQMELARKEHEFQMQQDCLIMQAFQQQTTQLMDMAKRMCERWGETASEGARCEESQSHDHELGQAYMDDADNLDDDMTTKSPENGNGLNGLDGDMDDDSSGAIGLGLNVEVQLTEPDAADEESPMNSEALPAETTSKIANEQLSTDANQAETNTTQSANDNPDDGHLGDDSILGQMQQSSLQSSSSESSDSSDDSDDDTDDDSDDDDDDGDDDDDEEAEDNDENAVNGGNQIQIEPPPTFDSLNGGGAGLISQPVDSSALVEN